MVVKLIGETKYKLIKPECSKKDNIDNMIFGWEEKVCWVLKNKLNELKRGFSARFGDHFWAKNFNE